jgi:hypothetical protein
MPQDNLSSGVVEREPIIRAEYAYNDENGDQLSETVAFPAPKEVIERLTTIIGTREIDMLAMDVEYSDGNITGFAEVIENLQENISPEELNDLTQKIAGMDRHGQHILVNALDLFRRGDSEGLWNTVESIAQTPEPERSAEPEKRNLEGYEELFSVRLDGVTEIVAEKKGADMPYMLCDASRNNILGVKEYRNGIVSDDYLEIMREFTRRINVRLDGLDLGRVYRGSPFDDYRLTAMDCVPGGMDTDLTGKVVVIKPDSLSPEFRSRSFQLALTTGGFGCSPGARGRAVYCTELYSGDKARWERDDILGVASEGVIPKWAKEKLAELQNKPTERESVLAKIKEARDQPKQPRKPKSKGKPERSCDRQETQRLSPRVSCIRFVCAMRLRDTSGQGRRPRRNRT